MNTLLSKLAQIEASHLIQKDPKLGDRSNYVGASDIGGCLRATYFKKLEAEEVSAEQARIFKRGHLAERFILDTFRAAGIAITDQVEICNEDATIRAHIDFVAEIDGVTTIIECKSTKALPSEPYESWVMQVHLQRKLLAEQKKVQPESIAAAVYAIDLNSGQVKWFGVDYNQEASELAYKRACDLVDAIINRQEPRAERQSYCAKCQHKATCPLINRGSASEETLELARRLLEQNDALKAAEAKLKQDKQLLQDRLEAESVSSIALESGIVSLTKASERKSLDTKLFKANHPELYEEFQRLTKIAPTIKIG